ncbi:C40 family peptidase [Methylobacterium nonmethylotrophicum]|uniref:Peptidase P60 n=1 Tax=Methylobacterium nonmethylotrophicum TaxID=1141884 RepID=A0A4Z0NME3_9HYPH|nr:NlpC/P60 family protein [Methylobacterium nonmethylotrophicum]TGD97173.1 peptidase P60 [Methylobacterium nonmethylotrophicum]
MTSLPRLDPRLTPARPDLADERLRGQVEAARYVPGRPHRVRTPLAPLRRAPDPAAALDSEALFGEAATVYDVRDGWAFVQLAGDGYVGYLPAEALGPAGPEPTHRVAALRTFLYPAADLKRPPLGALSLGAQVTVAAREGAYARLPDGSFVWAEHLAPVAATEPDWAATATRFLGVPYLWGGRSSLGLDCSGLVQAALAAAGLQAPRDSDQQEAALGEPVALAPDLAGLRRGDLVFWRGHVGMMLDATRLIHANGHHMAVAIEPLAEAEGRIRAGRTGPGTGDGGIRSIRRLRPSTGSAAA